MTTAEPQLIIPAFTSDNAGQYSVIQMRNDCNSESSQIANIQIQSELIIPIIETIPDVCEGSDITINSGIVDGNQFIWFTPTGTRITDEPELEIPNVSMSDAGSYSLSIIDGNCVTDTSEAATLNILPIPNSLSFPADNVMVCADEQNELVICISEDNPNSDRLQLLDINSGTTIQETNGTCFDISFLLSAGNRTLSLSPIVEVDGCVSCLLYTSPSPRDRG